MKLIIFTTICVKLKNNYKLQHRDYYLYKIFKKKAEKVKILILGVGAVGKSSFLNRYVDEKFSENIQATLGVEYRSENINIRTIKSLFKFGIQQVMKDLDYYSYILQKSQGVSLVYSVVDKNTNQQVQTWIDNLKEQIDCEQISIVLVANKCEISQREVTTKYQIKYFECSTRTGAQLKEMNIELVQQILVRRGQNQNTQSGEKIKNNIIIDGNKTQPKKSC